MAVFCVLLGGGVGCQADDGDTPLTMTAEGPIPQGDRDALLDWLEGGGYLDWDAESSVHDGAGPHFGAVRTYVNPELIASLGAEATEHPLDSATVKELYGSGTSVRGWSVSIKIVEGLGGDGWYWYEFYDGAVLADDDGLSVCTGCHASGNDFVLSPFPLQ